MTQIKNQMSKNLKAVLLIISIGFIVYSSCLSNPFIWDDEVLIVTNPYIRSWQNIGIFFTSPLVRSSRFKTFFYRPVQELSYALDFHFWRLEPFGYHLSNIFLHLINGLLIFFILKKISKNYTLSLFTGLLFIIHPIHTQAVTYISGRADLLAALFLLLALLSYIKSFYILSAISFIGALLSKEYAAIFPAVLIFYDITFRPGQYRPVSLLKRLAPFIIIIFGYLYFRLSSQALYDYKMLAPSADNFFLRIFTIGRIIAAYLGILAYPANLHMERSLPLPQSFLEPSYLFAFLSLLFIIPVFFITFKRSKVVFFFSFWFFIFLLPMLNILKLDTLMAEHWVYLASAGIFMLFVIGLSRLIKNKSLFAFILTGLLIFYASFTIRRNIEWGDKLKFSKLTLRSSPQSIRANYLLGQTLLEEGMLAEAIAQFKKTIALKPEESDLYNILGVAYIRSRQIDKAKACFEQSIKLDRRYSDPLNNLGLLYLSENKNEAASQLFQKALKANPRHLGAMNNLAVYYKKKGEKDLAEKLWKKILSIDPSYKKAEKNLKQ